VNDVRTGIEELLRLARQGGFASGEFIGQIRLAPFHEMDRQIPPETKEQLENIERGLENGSIHPDIPYKSP
jgi:basic membrane protein A